MAFLSNASERIDLLLALARLFDQDESNEASNAEIDRHAEDNAVAPSNAWASLSVSDQQALARRAEWYARLAPKEQRRWLTHTLARARSSGTLAQLDEHLHSSHLIHELRSEPPRIQSLVLSHFPQTLAQSCASALGTTTLPAGTDENQSHRDVRHKQKMRDDNASSEINAPPEIRPPSLPLRAPVDEVVAIVRRTFLARFVARAELRRLVDLELLSGVELVRLVRLLGVRETAVACRGIAQVEAVAAFLRRFAPEDARAIAAHISTLTDIEPHRVDFAGETVQATLNYEPQPEAMLDRLGLQLLAITLAGQSSGHVSYTAQKFPLEAAHILREMIAEWRAREDHEMDRLITAEVEALAAQLRRPPEPRAEQQSRVQNNDGAPSPAAQPFSESHE